MTSFSKHLFASLHNQIVLQSAFLSTYNFPPKNTDNKHNVDITALLLPKWNLFLKSFFVNGHIELGKILQEINVHHSCFVWLNLALRKDNPNETEPFLSLCYQPNDCVSLDNLFHHVDESSFVRSHHPFTIHNADVIQLPFLHSAVSNVVTHPHRIASLAFDIHSLADTQATCAHFSSSTRNVLTFNSADCPAFPSSMRAFADELIDSCRPLFTAIKFPPEHRIQLHRIKPGGLSFSLPECDPDFSPEASLFFFFSSPSVLPPSLRVFHNIYNIPLADYPMTNNSAFFIQRATNLTLQHPDPLRVLPGHTYGMCHYLCIHFGERIEGLPTSDDNVEKSFPINTDEGMKVCPTRIFYV